MDFRPIEFFGRSLVRRAVALTACMACSSTNEPGSVVTELWYQPHAGTGLTYSRPEVVDEVVVFGSPNGFVTARDVATGAPKWSTAACGAGGPQGRRFAVAGTVLAVVCQRRISGFDVSNGAPLWNYDPPVDTTYDDNPGVVAGTHPASDGLTIYVPAWGASVSALNATDGQARWVWRLGRQATDTATNVFRSAAKGVAISGDTVFVSLSHFTNPQGGTSEVLLVALNRATGTQFWQRLLNANTSGGAVTAPPVLVGDLALVLGNFGDLFAVQRSTGQIAWQFKSPAYQFGTLAAPVVAGTTIYATLGDEKLTALRADDGAVVWSAPPFGATEDLLATPSRVYVPRNGMLNIHDRVTGALLATGTVKTDGNTFTSSASSSGTRIFITSSEGAWSFREPE